MILDRLAERISIDWGGFAVTLGGFFEMLGPSSYEPWPGGRPLAPEPAIVASGGIAASWEYMTGRGWDQWRRWHLVPRFRLSDMLPVFSAPRGGISWLTPPITDDPYRQTAQRRTSELLGSELCLARLDREDAERCHETLWSDGDGNLWRCPAGHVWNAAGQQQHTPAAPVRAMPPPELPPQPAQPTMNLLEPETRSISDLIRIRLRKRR